MIRSKIRCTSPGRALFAGVASLLTTGVMAQVPASEGGRQGSENEFSLIAGAIWSDNVLRVPDNPVNDTLGVAGIAWLYERAGPRLRADIDLDATFEHYFDGAYDDRVAGGVRADVTAGLVPGYFDWVIRDNFGQVRVLPTAAITPNNTENMNVFTTGPRFTAQFGSATSASLSALFSRSEFETTATDNDTYSGVFELARRISATTRLSLNALANTYEYEDALATEYDREEAYFGYSLDTDRTQASLALGGSRYDGDVGSNDGFLGRLFLRRRVSPSSRLALTAVSQFSTSSDVFRLSQEQTGVQRDAELVIPTVDILRERYALVQWDFARTRTSFGISGEFRQEEYENQTVYNRDIFKYEAYAGRLLTRVLNLRLTAGFTQEEFETGGVEADEMYGIFALEWRPYRSLSWTLQYEWLERTSSLRDTEYDMNRAGLFVTWSPLGGR